MFRLSRPELGMFRLCSTYVSTLLDLILKVLELFRNSRPKLGMIRMCSIYASTRLDCTRPMFRLCSTSVLTVLDYLLTALGICFEWARLMFPLRSTYVSSALGICFDCARPMFRFSRPQLGMFRCARLCLDCARLWLRLCLTCFLTFSTEVGYDSTVLDLHFTMLDLCSECARLCLICARYLFRLRSTYVSTVLDL